MLFVLQEPGLRGAALHLEPQLAERRLHWEAAGQRRAGMCAPELSARYDCTAGFREADAADCLLSLALASLLLGLERLSHRRASRLRLALLTVVVLRHGCRRAQRSDVQAAAGDALDAVLQRRSAPRRRHILLLDGRWLRRPAAGAQGGGGAAGLLLQPRGQPADPGHSVGPPARAGAPDARTALALPWYAPATFRSLPRKQVA